MMELPPAGERAHSPVMSLPTSTPTSGTAAVPASPDVPDERYDDLLAAVRARFDELAAKNASPLFTTDAAGLFDLFLASLPPERRQSYTCAACRRFVDGFGGVVVLTEDGHAVSPFWDPAAVPPFFEAAALALRDAVAGAKVTGVFLSEQRAWGLPENLDKKRVDERDQPVVWHHLSVVPPAQFVFKHPLQTAGQAMAEKRQDQETLLRGLAAFDVDLVRRAHTLLTNGQLHRSEKHIGVAKWLLDLHEARGSTRNERAREHLTWRAAATAPAGFCHVRSSMIGTLLEDLAAGLAFDAIKGRFDDKMHPLKYQRPTAAPSEGNVAQAEAIMKKLGTAGALERRFATLEEILPHALWAPKPARAGRDRAGREAPSSGGVFGHIETREQKNAAAPRDADMPAVTMTWEKFRRTVLPAAESIEFHAPPAKRQYYALVTAASPDAPPILQWDQDDRRNPFSWYTYPNGTEPDAWNLTAGAWHPVTAVVGLPFMWNGEEKFAHQGAGMLFVLKGARDMRYTKGAGFFPEQLRSEYHAVRKTLEAYASSAVIQGGEASSACGLCMRASGGTSDHLFRVTSKGTRVTYRIDRWD